MQPASFNAFHWVRFIVFALSASVVVMFILKSVIPAGIVKSSGNTISPPVPFNVALT